MTKTPKPAKVVRVTVELPVDLAAHWPKMGLADKLDHAAHALAAGELPPAWYRPMIVGALHALSTAVWRTNRSSPIVEAARWADTYCAQNRWADTKAILTAMELVELKYTERMFERVRAALNRIRQARSDTQNVRKRRELRTRKG